MSFNNYAYQNGSSIQIPISPAIARIYSRVKTKCPYCQKDINIAEDCLILHGSEGSISPQFHVGCFAEMAMKLSLGEKIKDIPCDDPKTQQDLLKYKEISENYEQAKKALDDHKKEMDSKYNSANFYTNHFHELYTAFKESINNNLAQKIAKLKPCKRTKKSGK